MNDECKLNYLIRFDVLSDSFDAEDSIRVEETRVEMHRYLRQYIEAGCDIKEVIKMASPLDIFKNYDYLVSKGAKIDATELTNEVASCLREEDKDSDKFFEKNCAWFSGKGLLAVALPSFISDGYKRKEYVYDHIDELKSQADCATISKIVIDSYDEDGAMFDDDLFEEYKKAELDMTLLAKYAIEHDINFDTIGDDLWIEILDAFSEAGVLKDSLTEILSRLDGYFFHTIFTENKIDWLKKLTDNLDFCIDPVIDRLLDETDTFSDMVSMPEEVRTLVARKLYIDNMSLHDLDIEILEEYDSVEYFLEITGLSLDELIDKLFKEDWYNNCHDDWLPLQLFKLAPEKFDAKRIVQKVIDDESDEDEEIREGIYNDLKELGVDEEIIAPLLEEN